MLTNTMQALHWNTFTFAEADANLESIVTELNSLADSEIAIGSRIAGVMIRGVANIIAEQRTLLAGCRDQLDTIAEVGREETANRNPVERLLDLASGAAS